jgi:hypothetical protein
MPRHLRANSPPHTVTVTHELVAATNGPRVPRFVCRYQKTSRQYGKVGYREFETYREAIAFAGREGITNDCVPKELRRR